MVVEVVVAEVAVVVGLEVVVAEAIVAVVGATMVTAMFDLDISTVGTLPEGLPSPAVPWTELADVSPQDLTLVTMPARFADVGDVHAAIDEVHHSLEPLLDMAARDEAGGLGDLPYPPNYPKMPGEPKRVQPSRERL